MNDVKEAHNFLNDEVLSEREKFAHSEQRLIQAEGTLNDLWGISDQNLRHVVLTSSSLDLQRTRTRYRLWLKYQRFGKRTSLL